MTNQVFVYGTLKRNNLRRGLDQFTDYGHLQFIAEASTIASSFDMYSFGDFPGVTFGGNHRIKGEVWEVDKAIMDILDQIEGYPLFYNRTTIETTSGLSWIYYIHDKSDIKDLPLVEPVGDYLSWESVW